MKCLCEQQDQEFLEEVLMMYDNTLSGTVST